MSEFQVPIQLVALTTGQRDALTSVPQGALIFNASDKEIQQYIDLAWVSIGGGGVTSLNDLSDVDTNLPGLPTNADDGRLLYFDVASGFWISDDIATISNVVKDCKTSIITGTIAKGVPVYQAGYDNDLIVVEPCDASSGATMPCIGVTAEVLDDTNAKKVVSFGEIQGVDTSAWANNTELWVATGGGFTTTRPTGGSTQIQRVATVLKGLDATGGSIKVFNTSRVAGLPNVTPNNIWVGNANGQPIERDYVSDIDDLQTQIDNIAPTNQLLSGFVSYSGVAFDYNVSALIYRIQGEIYTSAPTTVSLVASDPTNDRIDVIYADINGLVGVIQGTPAPSPVKPTVSSLTQIEVTFIKVNAGSTNPGIVKELVYDENVEWTTAATGVSANFASTNDPYNGSVSVEILSAYANNQNISFTAPAPYTIVEGSVLTFYMRPKADFSGANQQLFVGFYVGGSLVGNSIVLGGTTSITYGLDASDTTQYQLVSVPLTEFGSLPTTVDEIRFFRPNGGPPPPPNITFFLDLINIEEGTGTENPNAQWYLTGITLGDFVGNGATAALAIGAGYYYNFQSSADDEIVANFGLTRNNEVYDGSQVAFEIENMLVGAGGVGDNVQWELDYAFISEGDNAYTKIDGTIVDIVDVNGRASQISFKDQLSPISGPVGATHLQITLRRNSVGPGSDSFGGDVEVYGVSNIKIV
jgi:hypothetical protein